MSELSAGYILARVIAEIEVKAGDFDAIRPEHFWMALSRLGEMSEDAIPELLEADEEVLSSLQGEVRRLSHWFQSEGLEPTKIRRKRNSTDVVSRSSCLSAEPSST